MGQGNAAVTGRWPGRGHGGLSVHPGLSDNDSQVIMREEVGFAVPNMIGRQKPNSSVSQKI